MMMIFNFAIRLNHILLNIMEKTRWKYLFFNSGEDFIKSKVKYDCIFLDIEMINLNGIEIATMIRNYDLDTYIIIVSGFLNIKM